MGCPFFEPQYPLEPGDWTEHWVHRPRLPLGEAWSGVCRAISNEAHTPPEVHQREFCNFGYARGRCDRFPASSAADAVRFSVIQENPLRLISILEKAHAPIEHSELNPADTESDGLLLRQARAFAQSCGRISATGQPEQRRAASSP